MKKLAMMILAGTPPHDGKGWIPYGEYPAGATLVGVTPLSDENITKWGGLFEFDAEEQRTVKRSFRVFEVWAGEAFQLPNDSRIIQQISPDDGGGLIRALDHVEVVYEVPWDFNGMTPEELKEAHSKRLQRGIRELMEAAKAHREAAKPSP